MRRPWCRTGTERTGRTSLWPESWSWTRGIGWRFPTRGFTYSARRNGETERWPVGTADSHNHVLDVDAAIPVSRAVTLRGRVTVGTSDGSDLPDQYLFFIGGANTFYLYPDRQFSFVGQRVMEGRGRHLQLLDVGLQWEFAPNVFALGRWNAAALPEEWRVDANDFISGFGGGVGINSRLGVARIMVTGGSDADAVRLEIDLGFLF